MSAALDFEAAGRAAGQVLESLGIAALPVDPFAIAARNGIVVRPKPDAEPGASGFLVKQGNEFGILYATHVRSEGFRRFTIAHELGHFSLPGHPDLLFPSGAGIHISENGFVSSRKHELEADHFAAGLLMPEKLFLKALRKTGQGLKAIQTLAALCKTSLTATAIRFAQHAEDPVAVIMSRGSTVDYCFLSSPLRDLPGLSWLRKGSPVAAGTATHRFNRDPQNVLLARREERTTTLDLWFEGAPDVEMNEDVVGLGDYNRTLTVLFADVVIENGETNDDEETP